METPDDMTSTGMRTPASPTAETSPVADSAMATGTDDEPDMTIADKHMGDAPLDPDGDGELSTEEAAELLGDNEKLNTQG